MFYKKCLPGFLFQFLILVFLLTSLMPSLSAQNKGLSKPQDTAALPKSRAAFILPKVIPRISKEANLVNSQNNEWIISDGYFTPLPGETRIITAECQTNRAPVSMKITAEGLNVPLQDIAGIKK